jgi:tetratricopeptide (TPR) repeat protein
LSDLATLPGEDRRQRLYDALAAYDDALRFRRPDNAPLDYAQTQNNRATILRDLATLPGEDRRQRLYDALAAYDDALRFSRPDNAPLAYATTQNNRAILLSALATLPGEDRRQRLYDALAATDDALRFSRPDNAPLAYATTQNNRANILSDLATLPGEDRRQRLYDALACSVEAVTLFEQFQQAQYLEVGKRVVRSIRDGCGDDFAAMWAELGLGGLPDWLREEAGSAPGSFIAVRLVTEYQALLQAADAEQPQVEPWRAIVALGERLLAMQPGAEDVLDWDGLREAVANDYNILGRAHDGAGNPAAALAAFARAVALQPDFAMWRRNQAGTLIDLGRLDEAAAAMARARALEPDAPRLAQLEGQLAAAREHAGG